MLVRNKAWMIVAIVVAIQGTGSKGQSPIETKSLNTHRMDSCPKHWNNHAVAAVVDVVLPNDLNFNNVARNVTQKLMSEPSSSPILLPPHLSNGDPNPDINAPKDIPFAVYTGTLVNTVHKKDFVMIRLIIPRHNPQNLSFHTEPDDKGDDIVGVGAGSKGSPFCQKIHNLDPIKFSDEYQVVSFYFDTDQSQRNRSWAFNILVEGGGLQQTPITIDPKVHDTGWNLLLPAAPSAKNKNAAR